MEGMKMKKILMVSCEGLGNGGVQAVMMSIVKNLSSTYIFDALLFTSEKGFYDDEFLTYGGQIYRIPRYEGENLLKKKLDYYVRGSSLYKSVLKLLQEHGPYDVIHCHDEFESAPIIKAAAMAGVPIRIVHTHVIAQKSNIVANCLENYRRKVIEKYSTVKIGCSEESCNVFYQNPQNALVINNAFDNYKFDAERYTVSGKMEFNLLQIGSYSPIKNQLFSIKIIECIRRSYPEVKLILVGFSIGDYKNKLLKEIEERKLSNNVILMPSNANTPRLLSESSGLLFPSLHEGFGIVLLEAQAMGTYCYASNKVPKTTNCGGVTYLALEDGAEKWAEKIMNDYKLTHGKHSQFDVNKFTIEKIMEKYKCLYEGGIP